MITNDRRELDQFGWPFEPRNAHASYVEGASAHSFMPNWRNDGNRISACSGGVASVMCVSFSDRHADNAWERCGIDVSSGFQAAMRRYEARPIAGCDIQSTGRMRVDFIRKPPH